MAILAVAVRCPTWLGNDPGSPRPAPVALPADHGPEPIQEPWLLIAKVRSDLEPGLLAAGFRPDGRNRLGARRALFVEYARPEELFSLSWDQHHARLTAEWITGGGSELHTIAEAGFDGVRSTRDIEVRLAPFMEAVRSFLDGLRESEPRPET